MSERVAGDSQPLPTPAQATTRRLPVVRELPWATLATVGGMLLGWRLATWLFGSLMASSVESIPPPTDNVDFLLRASVQGEAWWHLWLAQGGYGNTAHGAQIDAFPPLFAWLIALVHWLIPSWSLSGLMVTHIALFAVLLYLVALARLQPASGTGYASVAAVLLWPAAPFLGVIYPQALLLLTSTAALYHARRNQWLIAGLWALLAGLTHELGLLLVVPLGVLWLQQRTRTERVQWWRRVGTVLAAPLGFALFLAVVTVQTGSPRSYLAGQKALGFESWRAAHGLHTLLDLPAVLTNQSPAIRGYAVASLAYPTAFFPALIDGTLLLVAALAGVWLWRRQRAESCFLLAAVVVIGLFYGLPGAGRHLLGLAPLYVVLGRTVRWPVVSYLLALLGVILLGLTIFQQVNGYWAG